MITPSWWAALAAAGLSLLCGCSSFCEDHYFQEPTADGSGVNFFRLRVTGSASFSKARYVAGYYDERAVDLFFNEIKTVPGKEDQIPPLFDTGNAKAAETNKPPSPSDQNGAFVMILSSNAKAVVDVIGSLAESQLVSDAITNIVNRDAIREARQGVLSHTADVARSKAAANELAALFSSIDSANPQPGYMAVLTAIARHQGRFEPFQNIAQAREWFRARRVNQ